MGIYKIQSSRATTHAALRGIIKYVLNPDKTPSYAYGVTGHFDKEITAANVFNSFVENKKFWNQDKGRMYRHIELCFSPSDNISAQEAKNFALEFCEKAFPGHMALVVVHENTDNLHVHCVIDYVSYMNGKRIHCRREDLYRHRAINDQMCRERGLYVPQKGIHYNGIPVGQDDMITWSRNKHYALKNHKKKSDIERLAEDIINALLYSQNLLEFIRQLTTRFWILNWRKDKPYITFESEESGRKFSSKNIEQHYGEKFRAVFGDEFVLDKNHILSLLNVPNNLRKRYFLKFEEIQNSLENDPNYENIPAWIPPGNTAQHPSKAKYVYRKNKNALIDPSDLHL